MDGQAGRPEEEADAFARTRRSVVEALGDWGDERAWRAFYAIYGRIVYGFARRSGLNHDEASDVLQETALTLARQSREGRFKWGRGRFKTWLKGIVRWRVADEFRKRPDDYSKQWHRGLHEDGGEARTATVDQLPGMSGEILDQLWVEEWERLAGEAALEALKRQVSPRHFQIFHSHAMLRWPPNKVASELGVSVAQVYLIKHRLTRQLKDELRRLEENPRF